MTLMLLFSINNTGIVKSTNFELLDKTRRR